MVVVGCNNDENSYKATQIIDLSKQKWCKWSDFPKALNGATGAIMPNNEIIICGGYDMNKGTKFFIEVNLKYF